MHLIALSFTLLLPLLLTEAKIAFKTRGSPQRVVLIHHIVEGIAELVRYAMVIEKPIDVLLSAIRPVHHLKSCAILLVSCATFTGRPHLLDLVVSRVFVDARYPDLAVLGE